MGNAPERGTESTAEEVFCAVAQTLSDYVFLVSDSGRLLWMNPAAEQVTGWRCDTALGRLLSERFHGLPASLSPQAQDPSVWKPGHIRPPTPGTARVEVEWTFAGRVGSQGVALVARPRTGGTLAQRIGDAFVALGQRLSEASTPREVAQATLETADQMLGWDCAFIDLISEETGRLQSVLAYDIEDGRRQEIQGTYKELVPGSNSAKTLMEGPHMLLRESLPSQPPPDSVPFGSGLPSASLLFVPILKNGQRVGVMSIQSYSPYAYSQGDLQLLRALADYSGGAFQRTLAEEKIARTEAALREVKDRFELVARATNDAVYDWNIRTGSIWWNDCMETLFGHGSASGSRDVAWWMEQIHPEDREKLAADLQHVIDRRAEFWSGEYRFRRADGSYADVFDRGFLVYADEGPVRMIGSMLDITARKRAEEELRQGAFHDLLTGLANRAALLDELTRAVAHNSRRDAYRFAILFLDLDRFKVVNDSLGHAAGDQLLIEVARRLLLCVRPGDMVARLGGDEFVILLDDLHEERDATAVAERVQNSLSAPFDLGGREAFTGASIGIAFSTGASRSAEELLRDADTAMYRAKASGRGRFDIFDLEMRDRVVSALQTETDMRRALERKQFILHYQPVVELATGAIQGFEALLRWAHPERGLIPPGYFIPLAEETGLIVPIGWWVLREACSTLAAWKRSDPALEHLYISVNLSPRQIGERDVLSQVELALADSGLSPQSLKLEITEGAMMQNAESATATLSQLRALDVQLSIDDFGTGYSSLSYLHRLPINTLKIDRSFVRDLLANEESRAICATVIALAATIRLTVIAEGIETEEQVEHLLQLGCACGQGFYFSRPLDSHAARRYISALEP